MNRILINGLKSKTGGGKSILTNYLNLLKNDETSTSNIYYVLTPDKKQFSRFETNKLRLIDITNIIKFNFFFPYLYLYHFKKIIKKYEIDLILNLGDIIIPNQVAQIYLFDWAYAIYPESIVWERMNKKEYLPRKIKVYLIKKYIHLPKLILAQTNVTKQRLNKIFRLDNIELLPNAVALDNYNTVETKDFNLPQNKYKLLYLTHYYTHKNIEILVPLAKKIKRLNLDYSIIITISKTQHKNAASFIKKIEDEKLEDIIINAGPIDMKNVPSIYQQTDAIIMPTLLESFSGTYIEAMYHKKNIFTSNFDFAIDICGEAAFYFDPFDPNSILDTINFAYENPKLRNKKIQLGSDKLQGFPTWPQVFNKLQNYIDITLAL